jgi:hypothetical protein
VTTLISARYIFGTALGIVLGAVLFELAGVILTALPIVDC